MPTYPTLPLPYSCTPFGVIDPAYKVQVEQGYSIRRSRYSRSRHAYQITYLTGAGNILLLTDFIERELRVNALAFAWDYPYPSTIVSITAGSPNILTTLAPHGLQTRQQVTLNGTVAHDGLYTITRVGATSVALDGTAGGSGDTAGGMTLHLPTAVCVFPGDTMPPPTFAQAFGPLRDAEGLFTFVVPIEEQYG